MGRPSAASLGQVARRPRALHAPRSASRTPRRVHCVLCAPSSAANPARTARCRGEYQKRRSRGARAEQGLGTRKGESSTFRSLGRASVGGQLTVSSSGPSSAMLGAAADGLELARRVVLRARPRSPGCARPDQRAQVWRRASGSRCAGGSSHLPLALGVGESLRMAGPSLATLVFVVTEPTHRAFPRVFGSSSSLSQAVRSSYRYRTDVRLRYISRN